MDDITREPRELQKIIKEQYLLEKKLLEREVYKLYYLYLMEME